MADPYAAASRVRRHGLLAQSDAARSTLLELGKSIERQLAGGQSHEYHFTLQAGQYARVLAEQRTINVAVAIFGPDGKQLLAGDSYGIGDNEPAELIAETSGTYRLLVTAPEPTTPPGHYVVKLREIEAATQRHKNRVAAVLAVARASASGNQTREGLLKRIGGLEEGLARWRAAGDLFEEATVLYLIALDYIQLGEQRKALDYATQAFPIAQASHDALAEAGALDSIGQVYEYFGDKRKAVEYYDRALPLLRAAGGRERRRQYFESSGCRISPAGREAQGIGLLRASHAGFSRRPRPL